MLLAGFKEQGEKKELCQLFCSTIEIKQNSSFRRVYKGVNIRYIRYEKNVGNSIENPDIEKRLPFIQELEITI